jgi:hypothetical protein
MSVNQNSKMQGKAPDHMVPSRRIGTDETRGKFATFVGLGAALPILVLGVFWVFWQSYQEWGSLPSLNGDGAILYGGVAIAIVVLSICIVGAWLSWRRSITE